MLKNTSKCGGVMLVIVVKSLIQLKLSKEFSIWHEIYFEFSELRVSKQMQMPLCDLTLTRMI